MNQVMRRVRKGERFWLYRQGRRLGPSWQGVLTAAYAVVAEGHPERGWFPAILLFQDEQGRLWEHRTKAWLDFRHEDTSRPCICHTGWWIEVAVPLGAIPVQPFKAHP